jgi:hypothetical protein
MPILVPTSGSIIASDGNIDASVMKYTELYLVADEGVAASANITHGLVAASTVMLLRAPTAGMSQVVSFFPSGCLAVDGLENGDIIALVRE